MKKYDYLVLFIAIKNNKEFKSILSNNFYTFNYLFKSFKNVNIVDINNLRFLHKKNNLDLKIVKDYFPNLNIKFFSLDKFIYLRKFLKHKKIVGIKHYKIGYSEIIIGLFFKFYDVRLLMIGNAGNDNHTYEGSKYKIKKIKNYLIRDLAHKLTVFLSMVGLVRKIDIRFITNSNFLKFNKTHIANKIAAFFNLPYSKKLIQINSRAHDIFLTSKLEIRNDYITVLDEQLNDPQWAKFRSPFKRKDIKLHYKKFNLYLKKLSKILKKKIVICIHPNDNLEEKKRLFKNFNVQKYKTREYIYKSYLVVFFESSAIIDAVLLNKNITTIQSKIMDKNQISAGLHYVKELNAPISTIDNIENLNLTKKFLMKNRIIKNLKEIKKDYKDYVKTYICSDTNNILGIEKIKNTIKQVYRLD